MLGIADCNYPRYYGATLRPLVHLTLYFESIFRSRIYVGSNPNFQMALASFVKHHSGIPRRKLPGLALSKFKRRETVN